jgi:diguanylate cyclase (GGDEF)-like protein
MNWITPYRLGPEDRPHIRALHMALVEDLYERGRIPLLILTASMALFYAILRAALGASPWLRVIFGCLVGVLCLRVFLSLKGARLHGRNRRIPARFTLYFSGALATGVLLGAMALVAFASLEPGPLFLLCMCYMGICSSAVVSMAASPMCFLALVVPTMGSMVLGGLLFPPFGLGVLFAMTVAVGTTALAFMSKYVHLALCRNTLLSERLGDLALRDPLTGLRNRRYLQEFMHEETPRVLRRWLGQDAEVRSRRSISLILVDLDFFKLVNDQFGHGAGDAVLVQVAQLLREVVRKPDLVLRWGGEEFLILALDSDRSAPPLIAVRVHERLAEHPFILPGGQVYRMTCSVGFGIYPFHPERPDGLQWEQVFRLADQSLYTAKEKGRNRIHGITCGDGDPDAVIAALVQPEPAFAEAEATGLIKVI